MMKNKSGKSKSKNMKSLLFIKNILIINLVAIVMASCSQEIESFSNVQSEGELKFIVNVVNSSSRATPDDKTGWSKGDEIYAAIDADANNLLKLKYSGDVWNVTPIQKNATVKKNDGKINAVYAETLSYENGKIVTHGDVLYTTEGTYSKANDVVTLNLNMSNRPVAKIQINGGVGGWKDGSKLEQCWIEGLRVYEKLNISSMIWEEDYATLKSLVGTNCYYGTLNPVNGNTEIVLKNRVGDIFKKVFTGKEIKPGNNIVIDGPYIYECWDSWYKKILLQQIEKISNIDIYKDQTANISHNYTFIPSVTTQTDVSYEVADPSVCQVDGSGTLTILNIGKTKVTVKSTETNINCDIPVNVFDTSFIPYVTITFKESSSHVDNIKGLYFSGIYTVKNFSDVDIHLDKIELSTGSNSVEISKPLKAGCEEEIELYSPSNVFASNPLPVATLSYSFSERHFTTQTNK